MDSDLEHAPFNKALSLPLANACGTRRYSFLEALSPLGFRGTLSQLVFLLSSQVASPGPFSPLSDSAEPVALERTHGPDFFLGAPRDRTPGPLHLGSSALSHCAPATLASAPHVHPAQYTQGCCCSLCL